MEAEVTLLCVVAGKQRDLENSLERSVDALKKSGADFETIGHKGKLKGKLAEQMLAQMAEKDCDLVVVGYDARSFLEKALWGSLAARIAQELPVPVLIVRGHRDWINHVLIGISGSGFTDECVKWGGRIALAFDAPVTLLHVSPSPPLMYAGLDEVVETLPEFLQTHTPESQSVRQASAYLTELGLQTDVELAHGLPERELLRIAQNRDVDVLVIGSTWAAQPVQRLLSRNISEQVLLHTQRPVLVVRPKG
jgi:nucleotide-binding universal stress UspA family protein